jgi:hypothetical protein
MKRFAVPALLFVGVISASGLIFACDGDRTNEKPPTGSPAAQIPPADSTVRVVLEIDAPEVREPTFQSSGLDDREKSIALAAQRAVWERCSRATGWRDGISMTGHFAWTKKGPDMANVSVDLPRKEELARGNVLWYQITFVNGKPATILANKQISADLCGLAEQHVDYPL